ncbi:30S ribosomal protein S1 [Fusibacter bizertensis]|uniref:30S ribosomal protein S1 n=1 Tax=Fusibacter bizertensis TaxID=1488331 RepID=A0ABT6NB95_9FIRM|nr:30S ribosomal protein S1 [Fusibacter bizertensis]MDH8677692.1 30S ribosomal protein S1 [Fusibacter bizertensis]
MENQTMGELLNQYGTTERLYSGDVVEGTVISSNSDEVMVNINYMADGILPKAEIPDGNPIDFKEGQKIKVYILKLDDGDGNVLLSLKKAFEIIVWDEFQKLFDGQITFNIKVKEAVKGGVVGLYKGASVFIPASQLALSYIEDLSSYIGMTLEVELSEYQMATKKVVASHKNVLKRQLAAQKSDQLSRINVDDQLTGTVVRLADYGAFVDLGAIDGLIHVSQMSWRRVKNPSEILNVGDVVDVIVLKVEREKEKVSLKLAQVQENPWETISTRYAVGDVVKGKVTRLMNFGAFVEVEEGVEGLVHISELSENHVTRPNEVVQVGDEIEVMVLELDVDNHRMSLSLKAVTGMDLEDYESLMPEEDSAPATLSDLFGDKLKNLKF